MSSQHADGHHEIALASDEVPAAPTEAVPAALTLVVSTGHDERSIPLDTAFSGTPRIKTFHLGGPVADGHAMVESVLERRTGLWRSLRGAPYEPRMTPKILLGLTSRNIGDAVVDATATLSAYACLGSIGFLLLPGIWVFKRLREARRVRQGRYDRYEQQGSPVLSKKLPWELRCSWLLAAWKLFSLMRNFNLRAQAVNEVLGDATMAADEHAAALDMGELLCQAYPRIEYDRRFLEEDVLRGAELTPKGLEACSQVVEAVNVFGRGASLDWLILPPPAHFFTRAQVLSQWLADQEVLSADLDQDDTDLQIQRLEKAVGKDLDSSGSP